MSDLVPNLERATHAVGIGLRRQLSALGVDQAEAHVLGYLGRHGASPVRDIQRSFGHRRSTLTSVLDRLEQRALVKRGPNPDDRRSLLVTPTRQGRAYATRVAAVIAGVERRVEQRVSKRDLAAFQRVIEAIEEEAQ